MARAKEEKEVYEEFLQEAEEESKAPERKALREGIVAIAIGAGGIPIGLLYSVPLQMVLGALGGGLAVYANHHKERGLAIAGGLLALFNIAWGLMVGIPF